MINHTPSAMQPTSSASRADKLAELIRQIDGNHDMGAGALAEALLPHLSGIVPQVVQAPIDMMVELQDELWRASIEKAVADLRKLAMTDLNDSFTFQAGFETAVHEFAQRLLGSSEAAVDTTTASTDKHEESDDWKRGWDEGIAAYKEITAMSAAPIVATVPSVRHISETIEEPDFWPIAKLTVSDGKIAEATFYAPALPDGQHDVFPAPTHLDEHTAAWFGVIKVLDEVSPGWLDGRGNGIALAVKAIRNLAAPSPTEQASDVRNAALEEAALICDKSSLQPAIADRIRALKSATPADKGNAPAEAKS